ncbi:hypothetical protein BJ684DRAFT_18458 [Piptocephalis cylindrospora]|uniref:Armadillo-type protein n=1 Tax=Piptocephalis cylindrospora TaxID=1907219 RepID=A0A4P9YAS9_9FUNG|nr:hypothetical protein BJ684DRAFT_18458 [Piptocephalis cylindrospora]|eukprot:RKP15210.1 hypothetical protein BJ684DRAFT_18458 [Piptocephalis cylindrospora]
MTSPNLYSQAVTSYRILLDPYVDPWATQTRLALEALKGLTRHLPSSWYSPELVQALLRLAKVYVEGANRTVGHPMTCLAHIAHLWMAWIDTMDELSRVAMDALSVCAQIVQDSQGREMNPAVAPSIHVLFKALPRMPLKNGDGKERIISVLMGWITASGVSLLEEERDEASRMKLVYILLTSTVDPQVIQGISYAVIQCAMQAFPCLTENQTSRLSSLYRSIASAYLRRQADLSYFSRALLSIRPGAIDAWTLEEALLDSIPGPIDVQDQGILVQCIMLSGILEAYEDHGLSFSSTSRLFPRISSLLSSLTSTYLANRRSPHGCLGDDGIEEVGQVLSHVLLQHPHCLNMSFLTILSSSTWSLERIRKLNQVEDALVVWSTSELSQKLDMLCEALALLATSSNPNFALSILTTLDAFVGDTLTDFVRAEKTLELEKEKHSGMVHGIFRCMRLLFVVIIRFSHQFERRSYLLGPFSRGHYVDMMDEHGIGSVLKAYEGMMLSIATRLQQAPPSQISRVFRSIAPLPSTTVEDSLVRRGNRVFFLDLMEQFSSHLEESFLFQTILPILPLYMDEPEYPDAFGSTHSLILSLFAQNRECMIPVAVTYNAYLIETYAKDKLTFDQFHGAYGVLMEFLANVRPAMAWYCVLSLLDHTRHVAPGRRDPQGTGIAILRGPYLFTLGTLVCTVPYAYLPSLLGEMERLIHDEEEMDAHLGDQGHKGAEEAILQIWEGLSQELGLERKELVIKWWLSLQSQYSSFFRREHHL